MAADSQYHAPVEVTGADLERVAGMFEFDRDHLESLKQFAIEPKPDSSWSHLDRLRWRAGVIKAVWGCEMLIAEDSSYLLDFWAVIDGCHHRFTADEINLFLLGVVSGLRALGKSNVTSAKAS